MVFHLSMLLFANVCIIVAITRLVSGLFPTQIQDRGANRFSSAELGYEVHRDPFLLLYLGF